jgi:hypothetical protein
MFIFNIKNKSGQGQVVMEVTDAEDIAPVLMSGDAAFLLAFPDWLSRASGPFGHYLSSKGVRPNDLEFALSQDSDVTYSLVHGELGPYKKPPQGTQS